MSVFTGMMNLREYKDVSKGAVSVEANKSDGFGGYRPLLSGHLVKPLAENERYDRVILKKFIESFNIGHWVSKLSGKYNIISVGRPP